jgi:hypothetical protein
LLLLDKKEVNVITVNGKIENPGIKVFLKKAPMFEICKYVDSLLGTKNEDGYNRISDDDDTEYEQYEEHTGDAIEQLNRVTVGGYWVWREKDKTFELVKQLGKIKLSLVM